MTIVSVQTAAEVAETANGRTTRPWTREQWVHGPDLVDDTVGMTDTYAHHYAARTGYGVVTGPTDYSFVLTAMLTDLTLLAIREGLTLAVNEHGRFIYVPPEVTT